jgi:hypothetical protein
VPEVAFFAMENIVLILQQGENKVVDMVGSSAADDGG